MNAAARLLADQLVAAIVAGDTRRARELVAEGTLSRAQKIAVARCLEQRYRAELALADPAPRLRFDRFDQARLTP